MQRRFWSVDAEFSLAWLLQPVSVQTFLDQIWAKTRYHVERHCAGYFDSLLPGPSVAEELVELFCQESCELRLVKGKDKKGADSYRFEDAGVDIARIHEDFAAGYTIVLDGVERHVRTVAALSQSIEVELNFPVQVNAYLSPPGSQGLVAHYDDHDVLILQIQGSKIWHVYEGADIPPRDMQRDRENAVATEGLPPPIDVNLQAGDVLYLPRGKVHEAETIAEPSLHLTVGVHAPTAFTLAVGALYQQSFHDDRLNAQLPPRHLDDPDLHAAVDALMRDTVKTVEDPNAITRGLDALADVLVRRGRCPPVGPISDVAGLDAETVVRKYQPLYSRVRTESSGVTLQFASLSVGAAPDHKDAMEFVSRSVESFRIGELPGLSERQQIELARTLIVSGFLVRLPD
jgi:ribosomal protein L16 Arg81 hydroxylase